MSQTNASTALTHWFTWRHVRFKIIERRNDLNHPAATLLELHVIAARDTPVPITATGFKSHFISAEEIAEAGGPVALFTTWLDHEARSKAYQRADFLWRQGDLLDQLALDEDRDA